MCSLWFNKKCVYFRRLMLLPVYSNRFLRNHTRKVVPRVFPSCWKLLAFDQIQLDAYWAEVFRRFEATFKLRPVIPIFKRNEMTECPRKPRQPISIGITWHIQLFSTQSERSVSYRFFIRSSASFRFFKLRPVNKDCLIDLLVICSNTWKKLNCVKKKDQ